MFFYSQYCSWARSHRGQHCACAFYICTLLMYINTYVQSKPSSDQRCRRDLTARLKLKKSDTQELSFETDTETWKFVDYGNIFSKNFPKHVITTSNLKFFRISGIFPIYFACFSPADTADKKHVELQKFPMPYRCSNLKQQAYDRGLQPLRPRRDLKVWSRVVNGPHFEARIRLEPDLYFWSPI